VDAFLTQVPKKQYQATPEEVAWHYVRLKELKAKGMPMEVRVQTMREEAKAKPWEKI